jgi:predicted phosphate transport protein (TIGR00153 family)
MRLLRFLMPKEEKFIDLFCEHSKLIVAAADALAAMMAADQKDRPARGREVSAIEKQADSVTHQTIVALHRAFITPFDRSDMHALSKSLDDAVDLIESVVLGAQLYQVVEFDQYMRNLTGMIQQTGALVAEVMPLLRNISANAARINGLCEQISKIEGQADDVLRAAISDMVTERPDAITFFGRKEVYELLEEVTDSCDDVADVIQGLVLDHV